MRPNPFYLNIILLNKTEVVTKKINEKAGITPSSGIFFGMIGKAAASVANKLLTDEKLIANISSTLIEKIGTAVSHMGITATLQRKYHFGPFVVQVEDVDANSLLLAAKGDEFAGHFRTLLNSVTSIGLADSVIPGINEKIITKVNEGLRSKFGEVIPEKLAENGVLVDMHVCTTEDQAEYFFDVIAQLHDTAAT